MSVTITKHIVCHVTADAANVITMMQEVLMWTTINWYGKFHVTTGEVNHIGMTHTMSDWATAVPRIYLHKVFMLHLYKIYMMLSLVKMAL